MSYRPQADVPAAPIIPALWAKQTSLLPDAS
jgi:hypothetical protein